MASHRANMAFLSYVTTYVPACHNLAASLPGGLAAVSRLLDQEMSTRIEDAVRQMESIRSSGACSVAGVTTDDLIDAFEGDVNLLIAYARRNFFRAEHGGVRSMQDKDCGHDCPLCSSRGASRREWLSERVAALDEQLGALRATPRMYNDDGTPSYRFEHSRSPGGHWDVWAFTLAFAYHKLVPICSKGEAAASITGPAIGSKPSFQCTPGQMERGEAAGDHDGQIAYDLLPIDPARGYCYGDSCRRAVDALDRYRAMMHVVTPVRTTTIKALKEGNCAFDDASFVAQLSWLNSELPRVAGALRAAKAAIVPVCVVPSRQLIVDT